MGRAFLLAALAGLAGCAAPTAPVPAGPVPEGTAEANCARELRRRSTGTARIYRVDIFEDQRGIIRASGLRGASYTCFTNPRGEVVNIVVDRPRMF